MEDEKRETDQARGDSGTANAESGRAAPPLRTEVVGEPEEQIKKPDDVSKPEAGGLEQKKPDESDEKEVSALGEWFELIARAAFWALILYLFFFQVSVVDGPSMQPNFMTNDRLVIDKLTYRFSTIRRFDVVVFQAVDMDHNTIETYKSWTGEEHKMVNREPKDYIKRVIGLPGDKVEMKGCNVWINGKPLDEPEIFNKGTCYFSGPDQFIVPPRHYFVLGDNRGDSKDSRSTGLGFIPESQIRGIARLRFMPLGRWKWFGRE